MRLLNRLTIESLKRNQKRTLMTMIGIMLSVALITSIANLYVSAKESLLTHTKDKIGDFHYGFQNMSKEMVEKLRQNRDVEKIYILNEAEELVVLEEEIPNDDMNICVRYTKEALRKHDVVNDADLENTELIELERGFFFNRNPKMNTLSNAVVIVMIMIILTSSMCIKSSFDISVSERIRQYGMLASIGATRAQIRRNVYFEASILAVCGIPFGLAVGVASSYAIIRVCSVLLEEILVFELIYSFSWIAALAAMILSLFTIYISAGQSARKASRITPIQAIRDQNTIQERVEDIELPKWIRKTFGIGGEVAYKNLQRSKLKYRTTIVSLVISVSLFIAVSSFVSMGFQSIEMEYKDKKHNLQIEYSQEQDCGPALLQYLDKIRALDYVIKASYSGENDFFIEEDSIRINVVDDKTFREYVEKLQLDYQEVKEKGILQNTSYGETNSVLSGIVKQWDQSNRKYIEIFCEIPIVTGTGENNYLILNANKYEYLVSNTIVERIFVYSENPTQTEAQVKKFSNEFVNPGDTFWLINYEENEKEIRSFYMLVTIFLYSLIIVIAGVGVTNMFNIISANMNLRKREFAMLRSIGMTSKEFNRMVLLESFFYGRAVLVIGIPLGLAISYLLYGYGGSQNVPYLIPFRAILSSSAVVLLLIIVIMKYALGKFSSENIIETIRKENI